MNYSITRKKHLLMVFLLVSLSTLANARIWRVNNNAGISADTTSLIAAVALAANGDTIYVEPSATSYDPGYNITINKRLKIFGNGSFLSVHPGLQINPNDSHCPNTITFARGSSGSAIYGIRAGNMTINDSINDITIQRCRTAITVYGSGSNLAILENWLSGFSRYSGGTRTDLMIRNNIFTSSLSVLRTDVGIIQNNTIYYYYGGLSLNNANRITVINNILLGGHPSYATISEGSSASFSNNICTDNSLPAGSGNQNNVPIANILVNTNFTTDNDVRLKAGSPAMDAGLYGNGDDIGAFNDGSGRTTFVLGLIPPIPTIFSLSGVGVVNTPTMNITISTRSNN